MSFILSCLTACLILAVPEAISMALNAGQVNMTRVKRVVGGQETQPHEYPWSVMVKRMHITRTTKSVCGGSLFAENLVLTAAHCLCGDKFNPHAPVEIYVGVHRTEDAKNPQNLINVPPHQIYCHPDYHSSQHAYDIAVVHLPVKLQCSSKIGFIFLPAFSQEYLPAGTPCWAVGWGRTNNPTGAGEAKKTASVLMKAEMEMYSKTQCQSTQDIPSTHFCAGKWDGGVDTCEGDSGSPFTCKWEKRDIQFGITSFGPNICGSQSKPGVYTNVFDQLGFIMDCSRRAGVDLAQWYQMNQNCYNYHRSGDSSETRS